jgi:hypothetical protein
VRPGTRRPGELGQGAQSRVEQPEPDDRQGLRHDVVGDADLLQHPQHLAVEVDGARQAVRARLPLEHRDGEAAPGEQEGGRQPDGTRADDDHRRTHGPSLRELLGQPVRSSGVKGSSGTVTGRRSPKSSKRSTWS